MKKIIKKINIFIISILLIFSNISNLNAASASITVSSSSSVTVGNTFTVTFKVSSSSALGTWEFTPSYDSKKLKLTSGSSSVVDYGDGSLKSKSYTYKFKAIATGSTKITVKSYGVIDYKTESKMSVSAGSKTINIVSATKTQTTYSKNNDLKSLSIDGYKLTPDFNKNTTSYSVIVDPNTTSVNINASVDDSKAKLAGNGKHDVNEGENKINITVTAQSGSTKTYVVTVNVEDTNPIKVTLDDGEYTVVKRETNLTKQEGFENKTIEISGQNVPCLFNELNNYTLVGLKNNEGISLYLYDKDTNSYTKYQNITLEENELIPLSFDKELPSDFTKTDITINNVKFESYKSSNLPFYIIHARNFKTGKDDYYQYDEITNSIIRYIEQKNDSDLEKKVSNYEKIIVLLLIETAIIVFVLICMLASKIKKNKRKKEYIEKKLKEHKQEEEELTEENEEQVEEKEEIEKIEKKNERKKEVLKNEETKTSKHKKK